ncbi:hypothetical protein C7T94_10285 [Pedobacter yulinensis]|uniref:LamG domain-containing protein n=1 Tax=Pedobacter yulinensis TaxID=2126353 RepID=A0A2T3HKM2_9SPHI|nr:hypothetical protein [Pedobacter yulinensis]PST83005.1 hypothetical protein C7T94_10285 [Pedobacter yulinensis]
MKNLNKLLLVSAILAGAAAPVQAQFNDLLNKAKQKAADRAEKLLEKKSTAGQPAPGTAVGRSKRVRLSGGFDFTPGDTLLFMDNLTTATAGNKALSWKTNGSAQVLSADGVTGKWMRLQPASSYKLTRSVTYPAKYTIEFDLLVAADKVSDLSAVSFGFTKDNAVREFISTGDIWNCQLGYMNNDDFSVSSRATDKHLPGEFDFEPYANRPMHVSVAVNGKNVAVYLDQTKITDTQLFGSEPASHFFISGPWQADHEANILLGNFVVKGFKNQ